MQSKKIKNKILKVKTFLNQLYVSNKISTAEETPGTA